MIVRNSIKDTRTPSRTHADKRNIVTAKEGEEEEEKKVEDEKKEKKEEGEKEKEEKHISMEEQETESLLANAIQSVLQP